MFLTFDSVSQYSETKIHTYTYIVDKDVSNIGFGHSVLEQKSTSFAYVFILFVSTNDTILQHYFDHTEAMVTQQRVSFYII